MLNKHEFLIPVLLGQVFFFFFFNSNTGHCIPKDTIVISNLWYMMHDPAVWDDPYEFKPERFLDTEGHLNKNTALVPFGIGKE